ncbi:MAG TPA: cupin domain-containing protein [Bacillota bacterium]|nr:cupin domain-containing protein [Bacillota bacterium]
MIVGHIDDCQKINLEGLAGVIKQVPISPEQGWEGYVMRVFTLEAGCCSPRHRHPWPHINWMVSGTGSLHINGTDYPVREGSFAFVPAGAEHQYSNTGTRPFVFICIVPEEGDV